MGKDKAVYEILCSSYYSIKCFLQIYTKSVGFLGGFLPAIIGTCPVELVVRKIYVPIKKTRI